MGSELRNLERSITGEDLIAELDRLAAERGTYPAVLRCDRMNRVIQAVRSTVPESMWPEIRRHLEEDDDTAETCWRKGTGTASSPTTTLSTPTTPISSTSSISSARQSRNWQTDEIVVTCDWFNAPNHLCPAGFSASVVTAVLTRRLRMVSCPTKFRRKGALVACHDQSRR